MLTECLDMNLDHLDRSALAPRAHAWSIWSHVQAFAFATRLSITPPPRSALAGSSSASVGSSSHTTPKRESTGAGAAGLDPELG
jgi:hypothetical protein